MGAEYAHNATTTIPGNGNALTKKWKMMMIYKKESKYAAAAAPAATAQKKLHMHLLLVDIFVLDDVVSLRKI